MPCRKFIFYIISPCIFWAPILLSGHVHAPSPVEIKRSAGRDTQKKSTKEPSIAKKRQSPKQKQALAPKEIVNLYAKLNGLYATPEFQQAGPKKKKLMAKQYFLELKWDSLKSAMRILLIGSILSWGVIFVAWYFIPKGISYGLQALTKQLKNEGVIDNWASDKDENILILALTTLCRGIGYCWQFFYDNAPPYYMDKRGKHITTYLEQTSFFTKTNLMHKAYVGADNFKTTGNDTWKNAFIFCTQQLISPHAEAIVLGIIYAIFRGENPFPTNPFTLACFIVAPRAYLYTYITLRFLTWLYKKGYRQLVKPTGTLLAGSLPSDPIQPAQIAYVKERHTLRKDLQRSIESKLFEAQNISTPIAAKKVMRFIAQALRMHRVTSRKTTLPVISSLDRANIHYQRFYATKLEKKLAHYDRKTIRAFSSLVQYYLHGKPKRYVITGNKGVGKTFAIYSLRPVLRSYIARVNLSECSASEFTGTRDNPGRLVRTLIRYRTPVAILLFDQLNQLTESTSLKSQRLLSHLAKVFDKKNSNSFYSPYFQARFPLPPIVIFTFTPPLGPLSPSEILPDTLIETSKHIDLPGYTSKQKVAMALSYYLPIVCKNLRIDKESLILMDYQYIEEEVRKLDGMDAMDIEATVYRCIRTRKQYRKKRMRLLLAKQRTLSQKGKRSQTKTTPTVAPKKPTKKPAQKRTTTPAQKPVKTPQKKPAEKPVQIPIATPAQNPADKPTEKPVEKPVQTPKKKPAEKPVQIPIATPAQNPAEKPVEKPVQKPTATPIQKSAEAPTTQPVAKPEAPPTATLVTVTPPPPSAKKTAPVKKEDELPPVITIRI